MYKERCGLNYQVYGDNLFIGGTFAKTTDNAITSNNAIIYNIVKNEFTAMPNSGFNGEVYSFVYDGTNILVCGTFTASSDTTITLDNIGNYYIGDLTVLNNGTTIDILSNFGVSGQYFYSNSTWNKLTLS